MRKHIFLAVVGTFVILAVMLGFFIVRTSDNSLDTEIVATPDISFPLQNNQFPVSPAGLPETAERGLTLMFVGDIMLSRAVGSKMARENDYLWPFRDIKETLDSSDILMGNLESMISDKGENVGSIYSFRADPQAIQGLEYAGFDAVSVANNHAADWTRAAFVDTIERLKKR